jgi:post-segregation antitoxin (ccd killing protein)
MGSDRSALKRPINVSRSDEVVREARLYTRNLSGTTQDLLQDFVARERARRLERDAAVERMVASWNAFHDQNGLLSDEFQQL